VLIEVTHTTAAPAVSRNTTTSESGLWRERLMQGVTEATDNRDAGKVNVEDEATDRPIARRVGMD